MVVRGQHDGPTLAVTGGVHAAEYVSIEAVTRLSRWADPSTLRGTLIAVLIVNTPGFFEHTIYVNPVDGKDFVFPGNPAGTASERVANFLMTELIDGADAYIDAHCGDMIEALAPFTLWPRVDDAGVSERAHAMAMAYGLERTLGMDLKNVPGRSYAEAAASGVPAIVGKAGQQGICDEHFVQIHLRGLQNVMAHLGMVDPLGPPPAPPRELQGLAWTRSSVAGTYHPVVAVGDLVERGQPTGGAARPVRQHDRGAPIAGLRRGGVPGNRAGRRGRRTADRHRRLRPGPGARRPGPGRPVRRDGGSRKSLRRERCVIRDG